MRYILSYSWALDSYNHGSAQNIDIITKFMCDQLVNTCKADATARNTCADAITAASSATPVKTGIQADAFNAVFGITTDFAADPVFDNQGRLVSGGVNNGNNNTKTDDNGDDNGDNNNDNAGGNNDENTGNNHSCNPTNGGNNNGNTTDSGGNDGNIGNFGSCSVPEIEFGAGFDGRRETSFQPVDLGESNVSLPTYVIIFRKSFTLTS